MNKSNVFVQFKCRSGARFADLYPWRKKNLSNLVQQHDWITLYTWLGKWDTTQTSGRFTSIVLRFVDFTLCVNNID